MIDSELQADLRKRFNPEGSQLRRYQLHLLGMLKDFDTICNELGVKYWLSSGSVLGAVRHGGFLPWDDDMDVEMLREDYEKLLRNFKETDRYVLQTHSSDKYYSPLLHAKLRDKSGITVQFDGLDTHFKYRGPFIDIFMMENTHKFTSRLLFQGQRIISRLSRNRHKLLYDTAYSIVCRILEGARWIIRHTTDLLPGKKLRFAYGSCFYMASRAPESIFPIGKITFEGYEFPAPHDCHKYLRHVFGDYEKIPDISEIRIHLSDFEFKD